MSPLVYFADFKSPEDAPPVAVSSISAPAQPAQGTAVATSITAYDATLVDPRPTLRPEALHFAHNAPLQTAFSPPHSARHEIKPAAPPIQETQVQSPLETAEVSEPTPAPVPLPVPRPADLGMPKSAAPAQIASARVPAPITRRAMAQASPAPVEASPDNRNFLEKLFGVRPASPPEAALSYAALDKGTGSISPTSRFVPAPDQAGAGTAIYDITAQVVILPNGERLEAHSGLGDKMDDPRYVNVRMQGATPPGTYIITERERLFHGVRALRLNPVGGSAAIYGRDGILAHSYLLGPRGDSNGCVSFKNYDRFLQAYLRGEVKRLVVTAGRGQDLLPRMANDGARSRRSARAI